MEYRIVLSQKEVNELLNKLEILSTDYVRDTYTGEKRFRYDENKISTEKDYNTPVTGVIHRYSSDCKYEDLGIVWLEYKWTEKTARFEIEFPDINLVPEEFKGRENIPGWDILK